MWEIKDVEEYFYNETKDLNISKTELIETKHSYFDTVDCYLISTVQGYDFYVFVGDTTLTNLYPTRKGETLDECYYKHVGFIAEYSSAAIHQNFILDFIKDTSIFPIIDRRMQEIAGDITLDKNSNQLSGISNQIRDCYIVLSDYLMNKVRSQNPNFKNDNFKDNLEEFLKVILPGSHSETRRNVINTIAQKGWKMTAEMVHKDSVTVFDILISFNILQLIVSTISNIIVGNNMPFNKVKCPLCMGEKHTMQQNKDKVGYHYICSSCGHVFEVSMDDIIKKL